MSSSRVSREPFWTLWRISSGRFARTNARTSCRKDFSSGVKLTSMPIQQIRVFTNDLFVERLELQEAGAARAHRRGPEDGAAPPALAGLAPLPPHHPSPATPP